MITLIAILFDKSGNELITRSQQRFQRICLARPGAAMESVQAEETVSVIKLETQPPGRGSHGTAVQQTD